MVQKDTCTPVFITLLFTIAKIRKQSKHLSTAEDKNVACVCVSHSVMFDAYNPMDRARQAPRSSVHSSGILQARTLEWVAISVSNA